MASHADASPFADLVQIRAQGPAAGQTSIGSGLLVLPGVVLTALHCVADDAGDWRDRDAIDVYLWRDLRAGVPRPLRARLAWPPAPRRDPADLAILIIEGQDPPCPERRWSYGRLRPTSSAVAVSGFPRIAAGEALLGGRLEFNMAGSAFISGDTVPTATFTAQAVPQGAGTDVWSGMSGGAVVLESGAIVGVMRDVPLGWDGRTTLTAVPLAGLLQSIRDGVEQCRRMEIVEEQAPPAEQAFQFLWEYVYTLDRTDEVRDAVGAIKPHAGKRPVELLVRGDPEDLCEEFFKRLWRDLLGPRPGGTVPGPSPDRPPLLLRWPQSGQDAAGVMDNLAAEALGRLGEAADWSAGLAELTARLAARPEAPWLCLQLPGALGQDDIAALGLWRAAWAGAVRTERKPFGYFLLQPLDAAPTPGLELDDAGDAARGLAQALVTLRPIQPSEMEEWGQRLEQFEDTRQPGQPGPLLSMLAHQVAAKVRAARDAKDLAELRLESVRRLLQGEPAWYRRAG